VNVTMPIVDGHDEAVNGYGIITFNKNVVVFHQGDVADYWYEVQSGAVRTCRFRVDGHRQLTGFYFAGDVFGAEAGRYLATAETITPAQLHRHCARSPGLPLDHLERALKSAQQYIALFGHRSASERLAAFILAMARRPEFSERVALPMSRVDIADHLGLTIHTVSRTMSDFVRRRIVAPDGRHHVRIINPEKLAELAGENDFEGSRT
jgi:CRP/FNR family transcriptional regulator, nitrogen fixation regulation protein